MLEIYNLYISLKDKPLTWTTILAIAVFIIDKLQKRFIARYLRKLFNLKDTNEVRQYVENQRRIESKIDLLLKENGKEWVVQSLTNVSTVSAPKRNSFLLLPQVMRFRAVIAIKSTLFLEGKNKTMKLNKAILIPVLVAIAGAIKELYNYEIPNEYINMAADAVIWSIAIIGTFMHPKREVLSQAEREYING